MPNADADIAAWLASIDDDEDRQAVAAALAVASQVEAPDDGEDVYTPFVYPH